MTPKQVVDHYITQEAAAAAIGLKQSAVAMMVKRGRISPYRQLQWEASTGGALKADKSLLKASRR